MLLYVAVMPVVDTKPNPKVSGRWGRFLGHPSIAPMKGKSAPKMGTIPLPGLDQGVGTGAILRGW